MAKKPSMVVVAGEIVKVTYKSKVESEGAAAYGIYKRDVNEIEIANKEDEDEQEATLLHEVIHAILHLTGHSTIIADEAKEEAMVEVLERTLHKLYKRR